MQCKNFKDKIIAELDASYEYMKEAINSIKTYPKWSNRFRVMSEDRYEHGEQLYKMFMELYVDSSHDAYMNSIRDTIIETFATKTRLIEGYRATYDLIIGSSEPPKEEEIEDERDITNSGDGEAV